MNWGLEITRELLLILLAMLMVLGLGLKNILIWLESCVEPFNGEMI